MAAPKLEEGVKLVAENRRAHFNYVVLESLEAGIQLQGSEVKSLREGSCNLSDAYALCTPKGEIVLHNVHIGQFKPAAAFAHLPTRGRKVLLHRSEIDKWSAKVRERGYSIVPLRVYFKHGRAKVLLGLCKGKAHEDRRQDIKERETRREMDREMRRR